MGIHNHELGKVKNFRYRSSEDFLSKGQKSIGGGDWIPPLCLALIWLKALKNSLRGLQEGADHLQDPNNTFDSLKTSMS